LPVCPEKRAFLDLLKGRRRDHVRNTGKPPNLRDDAFATENECVTCSAAGAAVMAMADGYAQASGNSRWSTSMSRPAWATPVACSTTPRKLPWASPFGRGPARKRSAPEPIYGGLQTIARTPGQRVVRGATVGRSDRGWCIAPHDAFGAANGPVFSRCPAHILRADGDIDLSAPTRVRARCGGSRSIEAAAACSPRLPSAPLIMAGDAVAQVPRPRRTDRARRNSSGARSIRGISADTESFPASHPLFAAP